MISNRSFLWLLIALVFSITTSCVLFENTERKVVDEYDYSISPDSILESIAENETNIFMPLSGQAVENNEYPNLIFWSQSDYLRIANAFHSFIWDESIQELQFNSMSYSVSCANIGKGFQSASFSFFQGNSNLEMDIDIEHQIDIYPNRKLINAWTFVYNSDVLPKNGNEGMNVAKISAEEALMVAESNGGASSRAANKDNCEVSVILLHTLSNSLRWKVIYSPELFSLIIDPVSGKPIE
jgi:hypothetical protein